MRDLAVLLLHLLATVVRLAGPGSARAVVAESVLVKQQLLILNRSRRRSPNLRLGDRVVAGVCTLFMRPRRLVRSAIVLKPSTLLRLHRALTTRKYRRLFSSTGPKKPGTQGPSPEVIADLVDMSNRATRAHSTPTYLSSDRDRLYHCHQWQANLRILDVEEIKTVPYAPPSHPFVERLIGTIRRECVDRTLFWTAADLEIRLLEF